MSSLLTMLTMSSAGNLSMASLFQSVFPPAFSDAEASVICGVTTFNQDQMKLTRYHDNTAKKMM